MSSLEKYMVKMKKGGKEAVEALGKKGEISLKKKNGEPGEKIGDGHPALTADAKKMAKGTPTTPGKKERPYLDKLSC